jgi:hypothetical protein
MERIQHTLNYKITFLLICFIYYICVYYWRRGGDFACIPDVSAKLRLVVSFIFCPLYSRNWLRYSFDGRIRGGYDVEETIRRSESGSSTPCPLNLLFGFIWNRINAQVHALYLNKLYSYIIYFVGFEVFTAVVVKFSIFRYIMLHNPSKINRHASSSFLAWLPLRPSRWGRHVSLKLRAIFNGLHGDISPRRQNSSCYILISSKTEPFD